MARRTLTALTRTRGAPPRCGRSGGARRRRRAGCSRAKVSAARHAARRSGTARSAALDLARPGTAPNSRRSHGRRSAVDRAHRNIYQSGQATHPCFKAESVACHDSTADEPASSANLCRCRLPPPCFIGKPATGMIRAAHRIMAHRRIDEAVTHDPAASHGVVAVGCLHAPGLAGGLCPRGGDPVTEGRRRPAAGSPGRRWHVRAWARCRAGLLWERTRDAPAPRQT